MAKVPGMRGDFVWQGQHVTVTFEADKKGLAKCAVGKELRAACHQIVELVALPYAISISPRSSRDDHIHYQDQFAVQDTWTGITPESIGRPPMLRVATRLVNFAPHAAAVEWGNQKTGGTGRHVLRKTLQHIQRMGRKK